MNEPDLIRFFVDLTGGTESSARSVFMYLDRLERDGCDRLDRNGSANARQLLTADQVQNPLRADSAPKRDQAG